MQGGPESAAGVREGDILDGKYRVERVLGIGGMGVVVAANDIHLDRKVAIKFLLPEMLVNGEAVARFAREAQRAVKITSEHVARVISVGRLESGAPYMVMEFLDGADLAVVLQRQGPLPFEDAIDFVLQAGEAIAEAHALGIVHRDLKPANLFCIRGVDGRQTIKVLDFGISKSIAVGSTSNMGLTQASAIIGSPLYMSPEQMESSATVDARTDLWALGVILYELLAGRVPFGGETVPAISLKIAMRAPPPLRDFRPNAPDGLEAVILRCLEKDPQKRYRNVAELAVDLLPFGPKWTKASVEKITNIIQAAGLNTAASPVAPSSDATSQPPSSQTIAPLGRTASGSKPGRARIGMIAVAGVLVASLGSLALFKGAVSRPVAPPTTGTQTPSEAVSQPATVVELRKLPDTQSADSAVPVDLLPAAPRGAPPAASPDVAPTPRKRLPASSPAPTTTPSAQPTPVDSPPIPPPSNCDPPFTLDNEGRKHFKPECFLKRPL